MDADKVVQVEVVAGVCYLTMNRPEMNPLSWALVEQLTEAVQSIAADPNIRVGVLTGSGSRCFSVGADLKERLKMSVEQRWEQRNRFAALALAIEKVPKPIIAAVNGYALGGGFELALAADFRVAATTARFGMPEIKVGLFGPAQRLVRLVGGATASYLLYTGRIITADEARVMGVVQDVVSSESLADTVQALAEEISQHSPKALASTKANVARARDSSLAEGLQFQTDMLREAFFDANYQEGLEGFGRKD